MALGVVGLVNIGIDSGAQSPKGTYQFICETLFSSYNT